MLIQAKDKRLSSHEETPEQRGGKTDLFRGANVISEERRQMKGEKKRKQRESGGSRQTSQAFLTSLMR